MPVLRASDVWRHVCSSPRSAPSIYGKARSASRSCVPHLTATKIEDEPETRLVIKTTADRLTALHDAIRSEHPYETPQILVQTVWPTRFEGL